MSGNCSSKIGIIVTSEENRSRQGGRMDMRGEDPFDKEYSNS